MRGRLIGLVGSLVLAVAAGAALYTLWQRARPAPAAPAPPAHRAALAALREGRVEAAESEFRNALREDPAHAETYAELGNLYLLRKSLPRAIQALETATFLRPERADLHAKLAQAYLDGRRYEEAERAARRAVELDPRSAYALAVQGELFLRQDNLKEALAAFNAAIQADPSFSLSYVKAGYILNKLQRMEEAVPVLQEGLKRDPNNPGLHFQLAEAYFQRPQSPESADLAERHYQLAIPANPSAASAHARLGELAQRRNDATVARRHFEQALKLEPGLTSALYGLSRLEAATGNHARADVLTRRLDVIRRAQNELNDLKARVQARPRDADLAVRAARLALNQGLLSDASRILETAVRWNPEHRAARELRGRLLQEQGLAEEARAEFDVAVRLGAGPR